MSPALRLERVACLRGGRLLFEGVDVTLGPAEALVVTGPNGVGKSSLLRIAAGLLRASAGTVTREGKVALADDALALDEEQPLGRALGFWGRIDGGAPAAALAATGLEALAAVPVRWLSTGQRRRAGLARLHAAGAPIWLLDEPGNGLDADGLAMLAGLVAAHRAAGGLVLAATHLPLDWPNTGGLAL
ncbi:heme exporter protein A [Sphingomonas guangdongensis]|uniref:Heme exporter protein A n=1 Tax=Sphingomonas guangdongensis TaxID=1141890 RepID=A0A285QCB6_9SPHN|nr:heme ABC exporter ATP-binding protein CcmA [Sphingomonas guangdongensis]SOB79580.1 heme exporter protein A [Sphingomonas guangdongensis]